jgi:large subunit ribosomal protein L25
VKIVELKAEVRGLTGKNKVNKLRAQGKLPVNLYGNNTDAVSLIIDTREFERIMRAHTGANFIMKLAMDGRDNASVIVKEIQRHPTRDELLHVDLLSVALDEKITTSVPVHLVGNSIGVREGGMLQHGIREMQIEVLPADLPEFIEVDTTNLVAGQSIHSGEVPLPANIRLAGSEDEVVATVMSAAKLAAAETAEEAAVEGEEAAAEVVEGEES